MDIERIRKAKKFCENGLVGLVEDDGNVLYEAKYEQIEFCRDFVIMIKPNGEYWMIKNGCSAEAYMPIGEKPYIVDGKIGLKDKGGNILLEPIHELLIEWPNADVVYTETAGEFHYYNHAGEEILKDVRPLNGVARHIQKYPYYLSEEMATNQLVTREIIDRPEGKQCCFIKGHWERLDRIALSEVRFMMQGGELIRMPNNAFDWLESRDAYLYSAYFVRAKGENCVEDCFRQLKDMGCFVSSWDYIMRVWIHPETSLSYKCIAGIWNKMEELRILGFKMSMAPIDFKCVGVGFDKTLARDEMRFMLVRYYDERFPNKIGSKWNEAIKNGTFEHMKEGYLELVEFFAEHSLRNGTKYASLLRNDYLSRPVPANIRSKCQWDDEKKKYEFLLGIGFNTEKVIPRMLYQIKAAKRPIGKSALEYVLNKIKWLLSRQTDINDIYNGKTALDLLDEKMNVTEKAQPVLHEIKKLIERHHALRVVDLSLSGDGSDLTMLEYKRDDINYQLLQEMFPIKGNIDESYKRTE